MAIKLLIGGSPCTYWSIAQKNNRETEAEGLGWELFKNYLIAKEKFKPDFFLYENNKSAAKAIKEQISRELDTPLMHINSALVSAQNRERFYVFNWDVEQPEDRGILLRDILETGEDLTSREKSYCLTASYDGAAAWNTIERSQRTMVAEPVGDTNGKAYCLTTNYPGAYPEHTLTKSVRSMVAEPIRIPPYGKPDKSRPCEALYASHAGTGEGSLEKRLFSDNPNKQQVDLIAQPVRIGTIESEAKNKEHDSKQYRVYSPDGKATTLCGQGGGVGAKTGLYATPFENIGECETVQKAIPEIAEKKGYVPEMFNAYNRAEIDEKAPTLSTGSMATSSCAVNKFEMVDYTPRDKSHIVINQNAIRCVQDKNNASCAESFVEFTDKKAQTLTTAHKPKIIESAKGYNTNSKTTIYEVKNGLITIKGKQYPIKLADGFYIIRKLTVKECCRLQTMPDDYCRAVSNARAYKGLGNGWTAEVIIHILNGALANVPRDEEIIVLSMYDGIGTGRYCLDKMGFTNVKYYAYEIDKYAKQIAMSNYPDIIQCGDAFDLRHPDWTIGY